MSSFFPSFAMLLVIISAGFVIVMAVEMALLLWRRRRFERRASLSAQLEATMLRELMKVVSGSGDISEAPVFLAAGAEMRLQATSRVLQMIRGKDRKALLRLAEQAQVYGSAIEALERRNASRRVDAIHVLEQFPTLDSLAALRARMGKDTSYAVRTEAAAALARMGQLPVPRAVIQMLELLSRPLTPLHEALFRSSANRDAKELAILAADDEYVRVRSLLVEALGWSGEFTVLQSIERHSHDPDPEVRCAALKAAHRLEHPGAGHWALGLLVDPVEAVRIQAIQTCTKLGVQDAVPILASFITNPSWWVRTRAKQALDILRPNQRVKTELTGFRL